MTPWMLGHDRLVDWLTTALREEGCGVALHAGPGMGKTTLLRTCAGESAVWVDASAGIDQLSEASVPPGGLLVVDRPELPDSWWKRLETRRRQQPGLRVAVASRVRPPAGWVSLFVPPLHQDDAVAVLQARSGHPADPALSALAADLGGVPLALELAANRVRLLGVDGLRSRLGPQLLARGAAPGRTMSAAMRWSWQALGEDDRLAARLLSLFRADFAAEVAARVLGPAAYDRLANLQDLGLLVRTPCGLRMPEPARTFVSPMRTRGEVDRWVIGCLAAWAEAVEGPLLSGSLKGTPPLSRRDLEALLERASGVRRAQAICALLADTPLGVVDPGERAELLARLVDLDELPPRLRAELLLLRAQDSLRPHPDIPKWLDEASATLPESTRPRIDAARALLQMRSGHPAEAEALLERALPGLPELARSPLAQRCLLRLGACRGQQTRHRQAGEAWSKLAMLPDERVVPGVALRALRNAAQLANNTEGGHGARDLLQRGRNLARKLDLPQWTAHFQLHLHVQDHLEGTLDKRIPIELVRTVEAGAETGLGWNARVVWTRTAVESGDTAWARQALREAELVLKGVPVTRPQLTEAKLVHASLMGDFAEAARLATVLRQIYPTTPHDELFIRALVDPAAPVPEPLPGDLFDHKMVRVLHAARGPRLIVDPAGFSFDGGDRVNLSRRGPARRLMWHLAQQHGPSDAETLVKVGWPGEHIRWDAAKNRLHVTLSLLRKLGLRDALACTEGAWHVADGIQLEVREA